MAPNASQLTQILRTTKSFDKILSKLKVISVENGKCTAELKVEEEHCNAMGGLHGGFSATIVDSVSTYALATHKFGALPHVSVNINIEYLKGAKIGDEIQIIADTIKVGKTLAFLAVQIKEKNSGSLLVKGTHTKYLLNSRE